MVIFLLIFYFVYLLFCQSFCGFLFYPSNQVYDFCYNNNNNNNNNSNGNNTNYGNYSSCNNNNNNNNNNISNNTTNSDNNVNKRAPDRERI